VPGTAESSLIRSDLDEGVMAPWPKPVARRSPRPQRIAAFRAQAERHGIENLTKPSGAGHNTQLMTEITRAGMIFVPSIGGISHAPEERTDWAHIEIGSNLLLHMILALANDQSRVAFGTSAFLP